VRRDRDLFEQIICFKNLLSASKKASRRKQNQGVVHEFFFDLEFELLDLKQELIHGGYKPRDYRIFEIREPKVRKICSSAFRDRVVHHAICNILEPRFEKRLISDTYACRVGRGLHAAVKRCQLFSRKNGYYLKCDIRKCFETIDHGVLKALLRKVIKDPKTLSLLERVIDHPVSGNEASKGLPIGNLTSQHFANLYLGELDHFLKDHRRVKSYLRYMDDFILFSQEKGHLHSCLEQIRGFLPERLKLELKEKVTRIAPVSEGVPFLGFRVFPNLIRVQRANLVRFRQKLKQRELDYEAGELEELKFIQSVSSIVAHISHANTLALRRKEFHGIG